MIKFSGGVFAVRWNDLLGALLICAAQRACTFIDFYEFHLALYHLLSCKFCLKIF